MSFILVLLGVALYLCAVVCICALPGQSSATSDTPPATASLDLHGGLKTRATDATIEGEVIHG